MKKKNRKWLYISVAVVLGLLLVMKLAGKKDSAEKVAVEKAVKRTIIESVNASGKVYPEVEVKISPDISGEVTELNVEEGDSASSMWPRRQVAAKK